jgi:hypothetical protein
MMSKVELEELEKLKLFLGLSKLDNLEKQIVVITQTPSELDELHKVKSYDMAHEIKFKWDREGKK